MAGKIIGLSLVIVPPLAFLGACVALLGWLMTLGLAATLAVVAVLVVLGVAFLLEHNT